MNEVSNAVFPMLTGISWNRERTPMWRTVVKQASSGKEKRAALWSYPQWMFRLSYEFLEDDQSNIFSDFRTIVGFFNARMGAFDDFLYDDPYDNSVTNQVLGVGDGSNKEFQFVRNIGGWIEPINDINGVPEVYFNDTICSTAMYTRTNGRLTFNTPPPAGVIIRSTFQFYYRLRFNQDQAETNLFLHNLYELKKIEMVSVK